eukprot:TRINITY_DN20019_c0_g1_i1.p1 TRINITY_DN20019_c0_g1~~TRINITY_DN20019_c0_g1_i1.p1  ORF type:complete len:584 (+),score=89.60 TRINITY_DN20019_c0_g1_i1:25-1752(+)
MLGLLPRYLRLLVVLATLAATSSGSKAIYPQHLRLTQEGTEGLQYATHDFMVPMRDGTKLHTVVFVPLPEATKRSAVVIRTPYGTDSLKSDGETFVKAGHVAVMQDFRGRYKSEGAFQCWHDAATDGYDTFAWTRNQSWCNGATFGYGISANGIACYLEDQLTPPMLNAQFSIVGSAQMHRTAFQGGAYREALIGGWLKGINESSYEQNFIEHEALGPWWDPLEMTGKWAAVQWPAVHLTGWYDIFNQQTIDAFENYQTQSTYGQGLNFLVVLPGGHCQHGEIPWPGNSNDGFVVAINLALQMFKALGQATTAAEYQDALAKLRVSAANVPRITWYVLGPGIPGTKGNYWTSAMQWPTATVQSWYLTANGTLQSSVPEASSARFEFDPHSPVPTLGGNNLVLPKCGPWDQSGLENRADVLTFTSPAFDSPVAITGRLSVQLFVASNASDTDFTAKVTDVFPNGTSMLVQDGITRMRWRDGSVDPKMMEPGVVYNITVDVWSTCYIFNTGHRLRVVVSSSNSPRFSVNPNDGSPLYSPTARFLVAQNQVHFGAQFASRILLPVVPLEAIPERPMGQ